MGKFDLIKVLGDGQILTDLKCTACNLCENPELKTNCMPGSGRGGNLMFIGQAPGIEDDGIGAPFTGSYGLLFDRLLELAGIDRESVYISNCLKCTLAGRKPSDTYWKACQTHLKKELEEVKPVAIVAVGAQALKWLTGIGGVTKFKKIGLPCQLDPRIFVYPIEQPISLQFAEREEYEYAQARLISDIMWIRDAAITGEIHKVDDIPRDYKRANTIKDVIEFLDEFPIGSEVACDLETATPDYEGALFPYPDNRIAAIGLGHSPGHARAIPYKARGILTLNYWSDKDQQELTHLLDEFWKTHKFYGHNFVQFDQKWICAEWDVDQLDIVFESQYAAHLLDEETGTHGLQYLTTRHTNMPMWKSFFTVKDMIQCCNYLCQDIDATIRVRLALEDRMSDTQKWIHQKQQIPLGHIFRKVEQKGIKVSEENIKKLGVGLDEIIKNSKKEIAGIKEVRMLELESGKTFNPNAPAQVAKIMRDYLNLPCVKPTGSGGYSTARDVLEHYEAEPFVSSLLKLRRASKLHSTYYKDIQKRFAEHGDRLHTNIILTGTVTGRPASRNPNLFTIPRKDTAKKSGLEDPSIIKNMFIPSPGNVLIQADYKQAELRVLAMYTKDPALTLIFLENLDPHTATAASIYGIPLDEVAKDQRQKAKCFHPDTEVLTKVGWKALKDLGIDEDIVQAWPERNFGMRFQWTKPIHLSLRPHESEKLVHLKTPSGIDLRVTPDHRMLTFTKMGTPNVCMPEFFPSARYWMNAGYLGGSLVIPKKLLRLAVATQADGSIGPSQALRFGFSKARKAERLRKLLVAAELEWTESYNDTRGITSFYLSSEQAREITQHLERKSFPWSWLSLPKEWKQVVVEESAYWDSHTPEHLKCFVYSNTDKQSAEVLQAIAVCSGRKARITKRAKENELHSDVYTVTIKKHGKSRGPCKLEEEDYCGDVAVLSVPSSFVLVRDKGIPVVTGQSTSFGIIYGMSEDALVFRFVAAAEEKARKDGVDFTDAAAKHAHSEAKNFLNLHKENHPYIWGWMSEQERIIRQHRYQETFFGRRRRYAKVDKRAIRQSLNFPIQSTASDFTLWAIIRCHDMLKALNIPAEIVLTVYDSIVFDVPEEYLWDASLVIKTVMENLGFDFMCGIPLLVDMEAGTSWGALREIDVEAKKFL